jgi:predicted dehydrogenase
MKRREFIRNTAKGTTGIAVAANLGMPSILKSQSPNDEIGVGIIGFGIRARQMANSMGYFHPEAPDHPTGFGSISREDRTRGYGHRSNMPIIPFDKEPIRAVCDIYQDARKYASEIFDDDVKFYQNYEKILENPDIDAVMIFTPDHWHAKMAIEACEAGKDIFIEKCPTHHFSEGVALKKTVESHERVIQLNESILHDPVTKKMREIVRSGKLGNIHLIQCFWHIPAARRIWDWPIPSDLSLDTINWKQFLGPAPNTKFDPKRVIQWRCFWDYGTGICGDLFSHTLASLNYIMDLGIPNTAIASGGTYALGDYFHIPDLYHSIYEYPDKKLTVMLSANFAAAQRKVGVAYCGSIASMSAERGEIRITNPDKDPDSPDLDKFNVDRDSEMGNQEQHFHEFFDCIRTRSETTCNMDMCFAEDISCHMGTEAFHQGRKVTWDAKKMAIV